MRKKIGNKKVLRHLKNVGLAMVSVILLTNSPVSAIDPAPAANQVIGADVGKQVLNSLRKNL